MAFDENKTCENCLFSIVLEDRIRRCRFNPPHPGSYMANAPDNTIFNVTRYPRCPHSTTNNLVGIACGQWKSAFEEPEIEPEIELPDRIDKDED